MFWRVRRVREAGLVQPHELAESGNLPLFSSSVVLRRVHTLGQAGFVPPKEVAFHSLSVPASFIISAWRFYRSPSDVAGTALLPWRFYSIWSAGNWSPCDPAIRENHHSAGLSLLPGGSYPAVRNSLTSTLVSWLFF